MKSLLLGSACAALLALLPNLAAAQGGDKIPLTTKGKTVAPDSLLGVARVLGAISRNCPRVR